ncbi:hypothetical protein [Xanthomonas sp. XNM01]|jgi:hypothetical protein|uniref:hypothetical protein n=1 Tax=Xanthomonas sp. XNM01 TaxID=2769289 RepID=UPI00177F5AB4|nr:hypothetical protein [Xanthomonas sp. XNM01]MBD9370989.1 hypothetical protein [Xanthomonas sp. XNM01]
MKPSESVAAAVAAFGPLAFLSIQHSPPGAQPEAFTNEERMQAFRQWLAMAARMPASGGVLEG